MESPLSDLPALPEPDLLERIVTLVDSAVAGYGWYHPHVLIKIEETGDPASFDLGLKDLPDDAHPVDELWGFVAPRSWLAIGVVTYGWASPMDGTRPSRHPDRCRVRATILVDRSGRQVASATLDDGTCIDEPGEGLVGEVLQLCIGASTPPPPPVEDLCDVMWLEQVVEATEHRTIGWNKIQQMRIEPESTWSRLRAMATQSGKWPLAADWMDDGFFARQLLARLPSVDDMLDEMDRRLSAATARKLRSALGRRPGPS